MADPVQKIRSDIEAVLAELSQVEAAPRPADETRAAALAWLERHRRDHHPLRALADARDGFGVPPQETFTLEPLHLKDLIALLGPEALADSIVRELGAYLDGDAIPAPEREKKLKALRKRLHELEVSDEAAIIKAENAGASFIPRRAEADPAAILDAWGA